MLNLWFPSPAFFASFYPGWSRCDQGPGRPHFGPAGVPTTPRGVLGSVGLSADHFFKNVFFFFLWCYYDVICFMYLYVSFLCFDLWWNCSTDGRFCANNYCTTFFANDWNFGPGEPGWFSTPRLDSGFEAADACQLDPWVPWTSTSYWQTILDLRTLMFGRRNFDRLVSWKSFLCALYQHYLGFQMRWGQDVWVKWHLWSCCIPTCNVCSQQGVLAEAPFTPSSLQLRCQAWRWVACFRTWSLCETFWEEQTANYSGRIWGDHWDHLSDNGSWFVGRSCPPIYRRQAGEAAGGRWCAVSRKGAKYI